MRRVGQPTSRDHARVSRVIELRAQYTALQVEQEIFNVTFNVLGKLMIGTFDYFKNWAFFKIFNVF